MSGPKVPWRNVWITGASSGIGEAIAKALSESGVQVAASARSAGKLQEMSTKYPGLTSYPLDVANSDDVAATVAAIEENEGAIDLAILNAGVWKAARADDLKSQAFIDTYDVNVFGVVRCIEHLLPRMRARGRGHIAIVASVAGYRGLPRAAAYASSKAALINLAEVLRTELAADNIIISLVNPGFVDTPMTQTNKFPMPYLMKVEDAAQAAIRGLKTGRFEIAFPWQLVTMLKILRILPYRLYFWFVRRFVGRG